MDNPLSGRTKCKYSGKNDLGRAAGDAIIFLAQIINWISIQFLLVSGFSILLPCQYSEGLRSLLYFPNIPVVVGLPGQADFSVQI